MGVVRTVLVIAPASDGQDVGEAWLAHQWVSLLAERYEVTLLTTFKKGHLPESQQLTGVRVIEWSEPPLIGRFERLNSLMQPGYIPFYTRARRWIKNRVKAGETFDVIHQVVPVAMRYPSPGAGLGIPLVIGPVGGSLESPPAFVPEEGATPWWQRLRKLDGWRLRHDRLLRSSFESADCVVGIAPYVEDLLGDLSLRRFVAMGDVATDEVHDVVGRTERTGPVRLLHVGRTVRTKGLRDTIRAMARVRDLDVVLDVLGDGNDRDACSALIEELGLGDRVVLHGAVPRAAVDEFYRAADVFVFPSYREPGGSVVLEAMSFGLPLIVVDRGGPAAAVDDSCALLLDAQSPAQLAEDLAAAIRRLVEDPALRLRMGAAARDRVLATHLWSKRVDQMGAVYEAVSSPPRRS
ncbi:glycosyltransferase family 4 protein [Microbacterium rhizomatis]|uniref:Glycosyltransferase family 4 protein n=1 Tax=Microbacterium rhizomatis TaxID=1631477 RepID=A0A5J5IYG4_9MICO|nr:glycosyltransferase family 4 protein [Microbacterium rhizomatis]KAA9106486.1 glycosyltransferase family 4 protein [Microbacterium rhizomatis]